jgi:single-stranded DNA-specific DHH superfamily exonuclease
MTAQALRTVDAALDRYDETLIEWYRSLPAESRASLLAKSVLADVSPDNPIHRELARMVLADMEERSHV